MAEWYYVGHYGQLGPLEREQVDELIDSGVILRETYVWKTGMADWLPADKVPELLTSFSLTDAFAQPPPTPMSQPPRPVAPVLTPGAPSPLFYRTGMAVSDKSRVLGGFLNLIPGVGRMYLGYFAIGVLQLLVSMFTCGFGYLWPLIDAILILAGGVKVDGYGRRLND